MAYKVSNGDLANSVIEALKRLRFEPRLVSHGRSNELRGGVSCIDLNVGSGIDAAIVVSRTSYSGINRSNTFYKIDYAVRGNIKGVLPGRIMVRTIYKMKGVLRSRIEEVRWEVPQKESDTISAEESSLTEVRPASGEVWRGGPHGELAGGMNEDTELMYFIKSFRASKKSDPMIFSVISDGWNESLRITGNLWLRSEEMEKVYVSPDYLGSMDRIGQHIKVVRRRFGGLTF